MSNCVVGCPVMCCKSAGMVFTRIYKDLYCLPCHDVSGFTYSIAPETRECLQACNGRCASCDRADRPGPAWERALACFAAAGAKRWEGRDRILCLHRGCRLHAARRLCVAAALACPAHSLLGRSDITSGRICKTDAGAVRSA